MAEDAHKNAEGTGDCGRTWRVLAKRTSGDFTIEDEGILDEFVLDHWFHLERMEEKLWWIRIGEARLLVELQDDGSIELTIERGFYEIAPKSG